MTVDVALFTNIYTHGNIFLVFVLRMLIHYRYRKETA